MPTESDEELVKRSLAGEVSAFTLLVEKHQRHVFAIALSSVRDAAGAEDVAQEAFVKAWHDLPRLRDRARVASWIAGIARNLARRWHRGKARRIKREAATHEQPTDATTPFDLLLERETSSVLRDALTELPAAHREALLLFYVHGRSIADVAAALGISEDVVKQRLSRGRRGLRDQLESEIEEALTRAKPGVGFAAIVAASVAAATSRRAAAGTSGKVLVLMKTTHAAVVATVLVAAGAAWFLYSRDDGVQSPTAQRTPVGHASTPSSPAGRVNKLATRAARAQLLEQIHAARRGRDDELTAQSAPAAGHGAAGSDNSPEDSEDEDRDYVQLAMGDLLPSVMKCYEDAHKLAPGLAGTLVVNFTIEGEPGIGGLVTDAAIDAEQSEIKDAALGECVRDAVFSLDIDAPTTGGVAKISFPFTFGRP